MDKQALRKNFKEDDYKVELFASHNFTRRKCPKCGTAFWSIEKETCGDTACEGGYHFIGHGKHNWSFPETIDKWHNFFGDNGHTVIRDYPVVARWRDDIAFTIASIADFQPWVVNGTVDPPANPLVVAQPCLRFSDIDNVGKSGRHHTLFTMGGQHAFTSERLSGYWKDRCIHLNFNFLTKVMGIEPKEITYREDVWLGGGNCGPCLESFAKGLEIVNSVFMQYAITPKGLKQLPLKVIDVGWGVERIGWFATGLPTTYDFTFGPMMHHLKAETGVEADEELLSRYSKAAGLLNVDEIESFDKTHAEIAKMLGITPDELEEELGQIQALYTIADHAKALVFAIADGALPSNVGGGYNLRNLLRRMVALDQRHDFKLDFVDICRMHIKHLAKPYPRLKTADRVLEQVIPIEIKRFEQTLSKGKKLVNSLIESKALSVNKMVELYDSHGINPEMVEEIAHERSEKVKIPKDFYSQLEERHAKQRNHKAAFVDDLDELPPTEPEYYSKPYEYNFSGKITARPEPNQVVLDKTLFYPKSGGQDCDLGTLNGVKVTSVEKHGKAIIHILEKPIDGDDVEGVVDAKRRETLRRHHTATHIINAAARKVLGPHVWQNSANKTVKEARLDITHFRALTREEEKAIEAEANRMVDQKIPIKSQELYRTEAEARYGFSLYQGGVVPGAYLRVVSIGEKIDDEACGGTHCHNTSEVGPIVLLKSERIQDGAVRLRFVAGDVAKAYLQGKADLFDKVSQMLGVKEMAVGDIEKIFKKWKQLRKELKKWKKK